MELTYESIPAYLKSTDLYNKFSAIKDIESSSLLVPKLFFDVNKFILRVFPTIDYWGFLGGKLPEDVILALLKDAPAAIQILLYNYDSDKLYFEIVKLFLYSDVPYEKTIGFVTDKKMQLPFGYYDNIFDSLCIGSKTFLDSSKKIENRTMYIFLKKLMSLMYTYYINDNFESYFGIEQITNTSDLFDKIRFIVEKVKEYNGSFVFSYGECNPYRSVVKNGGNINFDQDFMNLEQHLLKCIISSPKEFGEFERDIILMVKGKTSKEDVQKLLNPYFFLEGKTEKLCKIYELYD